MVNNSCQKCGINPPVKKGKHCKNCNDEFLNKVANSGLAYLSMIRLLQKGKLNYTKVGKIFSVELDPAELIVTMHEIVKEIHNSNNKIQKEFKLTIEKYNGKIRTI